jgi:hypothetical protein
MYIPCRHGIETWLLPDSGVNVMITIFLRFSTILGDEIGVFLNNQRHEPILQKNWQYFKQKTQNILAEIFQKIITSVLGLLTLTKGRFS